MKNNESKKKEEHAVFYFTLSMVSLFAGDIAEWFNLAILEYIILVISILCITLGVLAIHHAERLEKNRLKSDGSN